MVFGIEDLWPNVMGKPEMTELEIPRELLSFPRDCKSLIGVADATVDELFAEIKSLKERLRSAEKQQQNLARAKQTAETHIRFFVDEKKKAYKAADKLHVSLVEAERDYQISQQAKICADEKCRRLTELLEKAEQTAAETRKENNTLTSTIATLQTGIKMLTDDQVKHEMTMLYHELEQWIFSYISDPVVMEPGYHPENNSHRLIELQSSICGYIHQNFWSSFFVGLEPSSSQYMMNLNNVIMEKSPAHIAQHWRYGMSFGGFMLREKELQSHCAFVVSQIGYFLFNLVARRRESRMDQLKSLIWRCIELKQSLEYQEGSYIFWTSVPGCPFRSDSMCNSTQDSSPGDVVQCSLWPAVRKVIKPGIWEVIVKEIVHTIPAPSPQENMADQMPGGMPDEESDLL